MKTDDLWNDTTEKPQDIPAEEATKAVEEQPTPEEEPAKEEAATEAPEGDDDAGEEDEPRQVPLAAVMKEREKRKEAEQVNASVQAQISALTQTVQHLVGSLQKEQPKPEMPDPTLEPEQFAAYMRSEFRAEQLQDYEEAARDKYGSQAVDDAIARAKSAGRIDALLQQRNPYRALMEEDRKAQMQQLIGDDPEAFRRNMREELRKELMAEMQAQNAKREGAAAPPSLAGETSLEGKRGEQVYRIPSTAELWKDPAKG